MTASPLPDLPYPDADTLADHWRWRPGWQVGTRFYAWHITVADLPELADHVAVYQDALRRFGFLDLIPRQWLHITVQGVDHTRAVSDPRRDAVIQAVAERLAALPAPTVTFTRPVIFGEAVVIPPADAQPLREVRDAIRAGIEAAYGPAEGKPTAEFRPHVSAAYVNAPADSRPVREALDAVTPDSVEVTITHASLIEMHRDNRMYEWTKIAAVPLGPDRAG
jgi:2'-5' RNA ligase